MKEQLIVSIFGLLFAATTSVVPFESISAWEPTYENQGLDVPYVPTPPEVVEVMLGVADVTSRDTLYDLGCGDGRIVVAAAKNRKVRKAVGFDLNPDRIRESNENAGKAGVADRVSFHQADLFTVDMKEASVVTLYLLPSVNLKLRPKLLRELKPGSRIVSHDFTMGDWEPDRSVQLKEHWVYFWVIPAVVNGTWNWKHSEGGKRHNYEMTLRQHFQTVQGVSLKIDGKEAPVSAITLSGDKLEFTADGQKNGMKQLRFSGTVNEDSISGTVQHAGKAARETKWNARRLPATSVPLDVEEAPEVKGGAELQVLNLKRTVKPQEARNTFTNVP